MIGPGTRAAGLALVAVAIVSAVTVWDRDLAHRLTAENGPVEWLQVVLCAAAAWLAVAWAREAMRAGRPPVLEVLAAAALTWIVVREADLDRRVFGVKVLSARFVADGRAGLPARLLAGVVVVGLPLALAAWIFRHRAVVWRAGRALLAQPWGRVLAAGALLFALTQIFERRLGAVPGPPRYLLEETLELVAAICFAVALASRR